MLDFKFNDHFWTAPARFPEWAGFQTRLGPYGGISSDAPSDGTLTVTFAPEGRDEPPLTQAELTLVQWLLDHHVEQSAAVLDGIWKEYPGLREPYGYSEAELRLYMPELSSPEGFRTLIGLYSVNVHQLAKDGVPYIGYEFGCTWDDEHGLGVLMHGSRVVEVGDAHTAFLLWIAEQDAGIAAER